MRKTRSYYKKIQRRDWESFEDMFRWKPALYLFIAITFPFFLLSMPFFFFSAIYFMGFGYDVKLEKVAD